MLIVKPPVSIFCCRFQAFCVAFLVGTALLFSTFNATAQNQSGTRQDAPAQRASEPVPDIQTNTVQTAPEVAGPTTSSLPVDADSYGLSALWQQGGWVTRICLLLLGLMSLASWYALLVKLLALGRLKTQTREAAPVFNDVRLFASHMATWRLDNPVRHVADAGSVAVHQ